MSTFKVDNEQVKSSIETLEKLLKKCEEAYEKELPVSDVDKGQSHTELETVCDNVRTICYSFGQLISNTIEFLGKSSEMFELSDKNSSIAIKDGGSGAHGGGTIGSR